MIVFRRGKFLKIANTWFVGPNEIEGIKADWVCLTGQKYDSLDMLRSVGGGSS